MESHLIIIFCFCLATITIGILVIPSYIKLLIHFKIGKQIRENALLGKAYEFMKLHQKKSGTPTMG
jgi:UDP-N-acetylmuramyl pentapeptide phosphotransferase/UDP-N-acetylglucosamine-1-phosphate transferase